MYIVKFALRGESYKIRQLHLTHTPDVQLHTEPQKDEAKWEAAKCV